MHLARLHIHGLRGVRRLELELHPGLNVFAGLNGAGKSTVLDAANALLADLVLGAMRFFHAPLRRLQHERAPSNGVLALLERRSETPDTTRDDLLTELDTILRSTEEWTTFPSFGPGDVNNHTKALSVDGQLTGSPQLAPLMLHQGLAGRSGPSWLLPAEVEAPTDDLQQIAAFIEASWLRSRDLPTLAWYPVHRTVSGIPLRRTERRAFNHPLAAYAESVSADLGFASFFEWFREREDIESEAIRYRDPSWRDPQLNAVRGAITRMIPELDGGTLRVQRTTQRMIIAKGDEALDVGQLSDGEKGLLALVGDLARRFAIANPNRPDPLLGEGIVLIDEIELHLHPAWQRTILNALTEVFPNAQLLVTTHSPTVLSEIEPERVFLLSTSTDRGVEVRHPEVARGAAIDWIQEHLMGAPARPRAIADEIASVQAALVEKTPDLAAIHERLDKLRQLLSSLDPELNYLDALYTRKKVLGR